MTAHNRRKTPGVKETKHPAARVDAAGPEQQFDPVRYEQYRQEVYQTWQAVKASYPLRLNTPQSWEAWKAAVGQRYAVYQKYADLYFRPQPLSQEAARYSWDFWRDIELLRGGDSSQAESAIAFLEADPWFHGSGYAKVKMIRYLKPATLTQSCVTRLQAVVVAMVKQRNGQDFRAFCRLARKVDAPALREQLTARLTSGDAGIQRRARWVLEALAQKDSEQSSQKEKQK